MACGLPVILSDITPHKEAVKETQLEKFLFPPTNGKILLEHIENIEKNNLKELSIEAKNKIMKHFTANSMSKQYQNLYEDLTNE
jgi:glycosyltransferase involved in cell wall biosynthesis